MLENLQNHTPKILLTKRNWAKSIHQRQRNNESSAHPLRWDAFLDIVSKDGVGILSLLNPLQRGLFLSWSVDLQTIASAILGRRFIFLAWSSAHYRGWRKLVFKFVLSRAQTILVNDDTTAKEVHTLVKRDAHKIPYFVDMDFFNFVDETQRGSYLFCPGSNDRDGELLVQLAQNGFNVVWMLSEPQIIETYEGASEKLKIVSNPTDIELKGLYQNARACILPLSKDVHAAGQTTTLEAISCGAPVYITKGRTSSIFSAHNLVAEVDGRTIGPWKDALAAPNPTIGTKSARKQIELEYGIDTIREVFIGSI